MEDWKYHATLSGTPQGGVVSPTLSNIYLDKLDRFAETVFIPGLQPRRTTSRPALHGATERGTKAMDAGRTDEARRLRRQAQPMASRDPDDPDFRRLWYVRYADDCVPGNVCSR